MLKSMSVMTVLLTVILFSASARGNSLHCDPKRVDRNDVLVRELDFRASFKDHSKLTDFTVRLECGGAGQVLEVDDAFTRFFPFQGGRIDRSLSIVSALSTGEGDEELVTVRLTFRAEGQGWANPKNRVEGTEFRISWVERRSASDEADGRIDNPVRDLRVLRRTYVRQGSTMLGGTDFQPMEIRKGEVNVLVGTSVLETFPVR